MTIDLTEAEATQVIAAILYVKTTGALRTSTVEALESAETKIMGAYLSRSNHEPN